MECAAGTGSSPSTTVFENCFMFRWSTTLHSRRGEREHSRYAPWRCPKSSVIPSPLPPLLVVVVGRISLMSTLSNHAPSFVPEASCLWPVLTHVSTARPPPRQSPVCSEQTPSLILGLPCARIVRKNDRKGSRFKVAVTIKVHHC